VKYVWLFVCVMLMLCGCMLGSSDMDRAMELRTQVLSAEAVTFRASVVADYGDEIHSFGMDCVGDRNGNVQFTVTMPESISGITGSISDDGGKLTFDDKVLFFELLTDEQLSPVSAPWILLRTLRSGYIRSVGKDGEYFRLTIDDSYDEDALQMDIWVDESDLPFRADVLYDGKRILSLDIENFVIQ